MDVSRKTKGDGGMNPFENSIYNSLNDNRRDLIYRLPDMHNQAKKDALIAIRKINIMISLIREDSADRIYCELCKYPLTKDSEAVCKRCLDL